MAQLIYVDLFPRNDPALLNLAHAAWYRLTMQVINLSPFPVTLDSAVIRMDLGTAPVESVNVERHSVRPGQVVVVPFQGSLTDGHVGLILESSPNNDASVSGTFEFTCRFHFFSRQVPGLSGIYLKRLNEHIRKR